MKTLLKTAISFVILLAGLAFSCQKKESETVDSSYDSISKTMDTVGPEVDTIMDDTVAIMDNDTTLAKKDSAKRK